MEPSDYIFIHWVSVKPLNFQFKHCCLFLALELAKGHPGDFLIKLHIQWLPHRQYKHLLRVIFCHCMVDWLIQQHKHSFVPFIVGNL